MPGIASTVHNKKNVTQPVLSTIKPVDALAMDRGRAAKAVKSANDRVEKNIAEIELRGKAWSKNKEDKVNELQNSLDALEETDITMELENHRKMADINQQYQKIQGLESELSQLKTSSSRSEKQIKTLVCL